MMLAELKEKTVPTSEDYKPHTPPPTTALPSPRFYTYLQCCNTHRTEETKALMRERPKANLRLLKVKGKKEFASSLHPCRIQFHKAKGHQKKEHKNCIPSNILLKFIDLRKRLCLQEKGRTHQQYVDESKITKTTSKILLTGMTEKISQSSMKYWLRRKTLFSRFNEGVKMDEEGLFSVTPEVIARQQAAHCQGGIVVDAFTGVGGNAIQFALMNMHVIAIDISPKRIECAQHNARIYGVEGKISFIVGDFFQLAPTLKADVIFLSPPWGGPKYIKKDKYDIQTMLQPKAGSLLFKTALKVAPSIAMFLPRTTNREQLEQLSWICNPPLVWKVEENFVGHDLIAITAYYGEIASRLEITSNFGILDYANNKKEGVSK